MRVYDPHKTTVEVRQAEVQDDDIGAAQRHLGHPLLAAAGDHDLVALGGQAHLQRAQQ